MKVIPDPEHFAATQQYVSIYYLMEIGKRKKKTPARVPRCIKNRVSQFGDVYDAKYFGCVWGGEILKRGREKIAS